MSTLLLRLAGPLQAWGDSSRFTRRETRSEPTKSGVLGLLAAAQGRRRTDSIVDLLGLRFGVRIDQPGRILRDFQTAHRSSDGAVMPLSTRFYLADAAFLAGVEGEPELVAGLAESLRRPTFPLYLGRRSCPAPPDLVQGVVADDLVSGLSTFRWVASSWHRRRMGSTVRLPIVIDDDGSAPGDRLTARDVPWSFAPERREYVWRDVVRLEQLATLPNDLARDDGDDFFTVVASA
ncbi:MAG: type I-E CRISPR-associated protein Cas5/CasD [Dermatophilaceae bacterium]|mgnify:CR=1 FL=1